MRRGSATAAFAAAVVLSVVVLFAPTAGAAGGLPHLDKLVHAGVFGLLVLTGGWRLGHLRWVLLAAAAYAVLSEVVQHAALPGRSGDPTDVVADVVGALLGRAALGLVHRRARRRSRTRVRSQTL